MEEETLEDRCLFYRKTTDYKLNPTKPAIMMLDGKGFSSGHNAVKKEFKLPYDDNFRKIMSNVMLRLCKEFRPEFAYTQSDEISLLILPKNDGSGSTAFPNNGRLNKLATHAPSLASVSFMNNYIQYLWEQCTIEAKEQLDQEEYKWSDRWKKDLNSDNSVEEVKEDYYKFFFENADKNFFNRKRVLELPERIFDCKIWNVPDLNTAIEWFLYRHIDCIRNSKLVAAQAYLSHKSLLGLTANQAVEKLAVEKGIIWEDYSKRDKYGSWTYVTETEAPIPEHFRGFDKNKSTYIRKDYILHEAEEKIVPTMKSVLDIENYTGITEPDKDVDIDAGKINLLQNEN